jgi:hypothetical protein
MSRAEPPPRRRRGLRNLTIAWAVVTVVTAPFTLGAALIVTLPVFVALLAIRWVDPVGVDVVYCALAGIALMASVVWFAGRADERPLEGVAAGFFAVCSAGILWSLRRPRP